MTDKKQFNISGGKPWNKKHSIQSVFVAALKIFWPGILFLFGGFVWLHFSKIAQPYNYSPAGSVAVCSALLTDLWLHANRWKSQANILNGLYSVKGEFQGESSHNVYLSFEHAGKIGDSMKGNFFEKKKDVLPFLQKMALENEYSQESGAWLSTMTAERITKYFVWASAVMAVFGTLVWGYGPSCSTCA